MATGEDQPKKRPKWNETSSTDTLYVVTAQGIQSISYAGIGQRDKGTSLTICTTYKAAQAIRDLLLENKVSTCVVCQGSFYKPRACDECLGSFSGTP